MSNKITDPVLLEKQYKDHTVKNAVTSLLEEDLPINARSLHQQPIRNVEVTMQIIDEKTNKTIETITGRAIQGSLKMSSSSLIRRTADIELVVSEDLFPQRGSLIWFNRIAKIYVGIADMSRYGEVTNFLVGTFWITEAGLTVDSEKGVIKISLSDKMTKNDSRQLEEQLRIDPGVPISEAIRLVMEATGETEFGRFDKSEEHEVVPYTLDYKPGDQYYTIIETLRDMYMDYVCGYNVNGEFEFIKNVVQKEDEVAQPKWRFDKDAKDGGDLMVSYDESYSLLDVRNRVIVYGEVNERTGLTPIAEVRITDPKSPFNVYAIGNKTTVLMESKLVTNEQCIAKARYEVWKSSSFNEKVTISCPPIYMLDAFDIIEVTHPVTKEVSRYQIDSYDFGFGVDGTMSINAHKLYFVSVEYGEEQLPIVETIINGINNWGWLSLGEERIRDCYNIMGDGTSQLIVRFQDVALGGEQASVTSYPTTRNQTMMIDIADFSELKDDDPNGDGGTGSKGDYLDRVLCHEMFHAVTNDYFGHDIITQFPNWFKEGFAEFLHGAKERFLLSYPEKGQAKKKEALIDLAEKQLLGDWESTSESYVAAYLIAIAIYRLSSKDHWRNMFARLKKQKNPSLNFLMKLLPIASTNDEVAKKVISEIKNMDDVWRFLFDKNDKDTGSVGGSHFMNIYNMPLDAETVFNNANASVPSIGFILKIEK